MTEPTTLIEWLTARTDDELVTLLTLRPDIAVPPPSSMAVLAARTEQRASVFRVADELSTLDFAVIQTLATAAPQAPATPRQQLYDVLGERTTTQAIDAALTRLRARALVWGDQQLHVAATAVEALPWPSHTSEPAPLATEGEIAVALAQLDSTEQALLEKLATTGPRGRTRDAAPGTSPQRPIQRLLAAGLLNWVDEQTVELPTIVGQLLRHEPVLDPQAVSPPTPKTTQHNVTEVDTAGAGAVTELLRHYDQLMHALGQAPAPALRAGGLGVRELRRLAKATGLDEPRLGLLAEVSAAAGLVGYGHPVFDGGVRGGRRGDAALPPAARTAAAAGAPPELTEECWAPTVSAEGWLAEPNDARWTPLAQAWLELDRHPWMIGLRAANDKPLAALSAELHTAAATANRHAILQLLDEYPCGTDISSDDLARVLTWRQPRRRRHFTAATVGHVLSEAAALGIVARGALTTAGRALLRNNETEAQAALRKALPAPVDHVVVQADLTVIAPGPLVPELRRIIELAADVESAGAATVYRISEDSIRRALDTGLMAAELHQLFATRSRTPVPQALTYLIDDVARRHGRLRVGSAQSFLRSEDPLVLAEVLATPVASRLLMRSIAPTVAIAQAPLGEVLTQLREAGFAPAGEDWSGAIVDLRPRGARVSGRGHERPVWRPVPPSDEQLHLLVGELRSGERAARAQASQRVRTDGTRSGTAATMALLQLAALGRRPVHIGYVDAHGVPSQRVVEPIEVAGGQLAAVDTVTGALRRFTLHRIASVALVDPPP